MGRSKITLDEALGLGEREIRVRGEAANSKEVVDGAQGVDCEAEVYDGKHGRLEGAEEIVERRRRGRPGKEESEAKEEEHKVWKDGFAGGIINRMIGERRKELLRIDPKPTEAKRRKDEMNLVLEEIGKRIKQMPDSREKTEAMLNDIDALREEAGIERLDDRYEAYREYREAWREYLSLKRGIAEMHKRATESLSGRDMRKAEVEYETVRKMADEVGERYDKVEEAYRGVCEALSREIADKEGRSGALEDPMLSEEEKKGYGMIWGEDGEAYQKRMKRIGRSKEVAKTIQKIDEVVRQTERRWQSVAGVSKEEFDTIKANFRETVKGLYERSAYATNVGVEGLERIVSGDGLANQYEEKPRGVRYFDEGGEEGEAEIDDSFSQKSFGLSKGAEAEEHERYGCLHGLKAQEGDNRIGGAYGGIVVRWKKSGSVATIVFTDCISLNNDRLSYVNPCLVTDPSPCSFNPENRKVLDMLKAGAIKGGLPEISELFGTGYIEIELHGRKEAYGAGAIESISFWSLDDLRNLTEGAFEAIKENGIAMDVRGEDLEVSVAEEIRGRAG